MSMAFPKQSTFACSLTRNPPEREEKTTNYNSCFLKHLLIDGVAAVEQKKERDKCVCVCVIKIIFILYKVYVWRSVCCLMLDRHATLICFVYMGTCRFFLQWQFPFARALPSFCIHFWYRCQCIRVSIGYVAIFFSWNRYKKRQIGRCCVFAAVWLLWPTIWMEIEWQIWIHIRIYSYMCQIFHWQGHFIVYGRLRCCVWFVCVFFAFSLLRFFYYLRTTKNFVCARDVVWCTTNVSRERDPIEKEAL